MLEGGRGTARRSGGRRAGCRRADVSVRVEPCISMRRPQQPVLLQKCEVLPGVAYSQHLLHNYPHDFLPQRRRARRLGLRRGRAAAPPGPPSRPRRRLGGRRPGGRPAARLPLPRAAGRLRRAQPSARSTRASRRAPTCCSAPCPMAGRPSSPRGPWPRPGWSSTSRPTSGCATRVPTRPGTGRSTRSRTSSAPGPTACPSSTARSCGAPPGWPCPAATRRRPCWPWPRWSPPGWSRPTGSWSTPSRGCRGPAGRSPTATCSSRPTRTSPPTRWAATATPRRSSRSWPWPPGRR